MNITQNRELQYSPVRSSDSPMAAKATTAMAVAPNSGHWFCAITSRITSSLSSPDSMRTLNPSVTTIALSVSMHSAMMSAPREMRSIRRLPSRYITRNVAHDRKKQHKADNEPGLAAHREQQHDEDDRDRLAQIEDEAARGFGDRRGLEVDLADLDSDWLVSFQLIELSADTFSHRHDVSALHRGDTQADGGLAVVPEQAARRIFVAALDRRDILEVELAARAVRSDHQFEHVFGRAETARRIEWDMLVADAYAAAVSDDIFRLELAVDLFLIDAELCQPLPRDFEEDDLLLFAEQIDFLDVAHQEQLAAKELGVAAKFGLREAFTGDRQEDAVNVAEIVDYQRLAARPRAAIWIGRRRSCGEVRPRPAGFCLCRYLSWMTAVTTDRPRVDSDSTRLSWPSC